MDLNLTGKIALVTGATSGVGSEIALSLAAEGASVAVNYRSSGEEADTLVKDIVAKGGKAQRNLAADAAGRAGHQRNLSCQIEIHVGSFMVWRAPALLRSGGTGVPALPVAR